VTPSMDTMDGWMVGAKACLMSLSISLISGRDGGSGARWRYGWRSTVHRVGGRSAIHRSGIRSAVHGGGIGAIAICKIGIGLLRWRRLITRVPSATRASRHWRLSSLVRPFGLIYERLSDTAITHTGIILSHRTIPCLSLLLPDEVYNDDGN